MPSAVKTVRVFSSICTGGARSIRKRRGAERRAEIGGLGEIRVVVAGKHARSYGWAQQDA
jgi:hypothetical protein